MAVYRRPWRPYHPRRPRFVGSRARFVGSVTLAVPVYLEPLTGFALATNTAEGGSNGTTVTTGNSGGTSGPPWDSVTIGAGSTLTFDSSQAAHGALSYAFDPATSQQNYVAWTTTIGTKTDFYARMYLYITALPVAAIRCFAALNGGSLSAALRISTAGKIRMLDATATPVGTDLATTIPLNSWFRVECHVTTNASTGTFETKLYTTPDSDTATETQANSSLNTGTQATEYRFGMATSVASDLIKFYMDDLAVGSGGYIGATPGVVLTKTPNKALAVTVTASAAIVRAVGKPLSVALTATATLLKAVPKALSVSVTNAVSLLKNVGKPLGAATTLTPALTKLPNKLLAVSLSLAVTMRRAITKTLAVTVTYTVTLLKAVPKTLAATTTLTAAMAKNVPKALAAAVAMTAAMGRAIARTLAVSLTLSVAMGRAIGKALSVALTVTAAMLHALPRTLAVTVSLGVSLGRQITKRLDPGLTLAVGIAKRVTHTLAVGVTLTPVIDALKFGKAGILRAYHALLSVFTRRNTVTMTSSISQATTMKTRRESQ